MYSCCPVLAETEKKRHRFLSASGTSVQPADTGTGSRRPPSWQWKRLSREFSNHRGARWMGPRVLIAVVAFLAAATAPRSGASSQLQATGQLQDAKLKLSRLETALREASEKVKERSQHLARCDEKIAEMNGDIHRLRSSLSDSQGYLDDTSLAVYRKIGALEEEKWALWASLRKNNFDLHVLESRALEAEDRMEALSSRVEKMADLVTEQWIQIQQFEQAVQLKQMRLLKAQRETPAPFSTFFKFTNELCGENIQEALGLLSSASRSYVLSILHQLEEWYSQAKKYHHELQGKIKEQMRRHEFTVQFASNELVFLVASAIVVFPVLGAWMLVYPHFT